MLEPPEPSPEVLEWLSTLHLSQYTPLFQQGGYHTLENCKDLTDEQLLELKVLPTGHRRRILRSLEALGVKQLSGEEDEDEEGLDKGQRKPKLYPRHIFMDKKQVTSYKHNQIKEIKEYGSEGSQSLPAGAGLSGYQNNLPDKRLAVPPIPAPRNLQSLKTSMQIQTCGPASKLLSSSSESLSTSEILSNLEVSSEEHFSSVGEASLPALAEDREGFHGQMIDNSIYETRASVKDPAGFRITRSYRLKHRPVPEIPIPTSGPLQERYF